MSAWHGDAELKARIVERMKAHREADDFIQGLYQKIDPATALGYRGCAIGCALSLQKFGPEGMPEAPMGWHRQVEVEFGIPARVAELIDDTFEGIEPPDHATFAVESLEAIDVGADLSGVEDAYFDTPTDEDNRQLLLRLLRNPPVPVVASREVPDASS